MSENKDKKEKQAEEIQKEANEERAEIEENLAKEEQQAAQEKTEEEKLKEQLDEMENRYLRLQADMENVKKRHIAEREITVKYRSQSLAESLLPALDSFEKALETKSDSEEVAAILKGMEMAHKQILTALEKEGIEPISALGEQFDPNLHQAVMQDSDDSQESNIITAELQKGYKLKDRVIRPSMVKVNQ